MARSIWRGTLVVGKVGVPITLHKAAEHHDVQFTSLHRVCGTPITQLRRCPTCDVDLEGYGDTVRGFEFAEGQYVIVENPELADALAGDHLILDKFVDADDVSPVQLDAAYWLRPGDSIYTRRAFAALHAALRETGLAGIGKLTMFTKERVVSVRSVDLFDSVVLHTLFTTDEVRTPDTIVVDGAVPTSREVALFTQVLRGRVPMRPFLHRLGSIYKRRVPELLERKVRTGETIKVPKPDAVAPLDLAAALKASIKTTRRPRARA